MTDNTKQINTTIPMDIWKRAMLEGVSWNKALITGIEAYLGLNREKKALIEEYDKTEVKLIAIKKQIEEIEEKEQKEAKKESTKTVMEW